MRARRMHVHAYMHTCTSSIGPLDGNLVLRALKHSATQFTPRRGYPRREYGSTSFPTYITSRIHELHFRVTRARQVDRCSRVTSKVDDGAPSPSSSSSVEHAQTSPLTSRREIMTARSFLELQVFPNCVKYNWLNTRKVLRASLRHERNLDARFTLEEPLKSFLRYRL